VKPLSTALPPRPRSSYIFLFDSLLQPGSYDPLNCQDVQDGDASADEDDYRVARKAVIQADWKPQAIIGAGHYLKRLFDDDDDSVDETGSTQTSQTIFENVSPKSWLSTQLHPISTTSAYHRTPSISSLSSVRPAWPYAIDADPQAYEGIYRGDYDVSKSSFSGFTPTESFLTPQYSQSYRYHQS
jgi:hypothetical protein